MRSKLQLVSLPNSRHQEQKLVFQFRLIWDEKKTGYHTSRVWDRAMLLLELPWVTMWLLQRVTCFTSFLIGWNNSCNVLKVVRASKLFSCKSKTGLDTNGFHSTWHKLHVLLWFIDRRQSLQILLYSYSWADDLNAYAIWKIYTWWRRKTPPQGMSGLRLTTHGK